MLKRILTLFAILTGLAAVMAPAQARFTSIQDIGVHATGENAPKCAESRIEQRSQPVAGLLERRGQAPATCRPATITVVIPTVMLQADRAWE